MVLFLFLIHSSQHPVLKLIIKLNTLEYLQINQHSAPMVCKDGSFLISTINTVWHFDKQGELFHKFGGRGQGPLHFEYIMSATWDEINQRYLVIDGISRLLKIIHKKDGKTEIVDRYFESLNRVGDSIFAIGGIQIDQSKKEKPEWILPLQAKDLLNKDLLNTELNPKRFHFLTNSIINLQYNYTNHFIHFDRNSQFIYVMNELDPIIYIYTWPALKKYEEISIELYAFEKAPSKFIDPPYARGKVIDWENSWSRIKGFFKLGDEYIISYNMPYYGNYGKKSGEEKAAMIFVRVNQEGKQNFKYPFQGYLLGLYHNCLFILTQEETEEGDPIYKVKMYGWE